MSLHRAAAQGVRDCLAASAEPGERELAAALRLLAKWRSQMLASTLAARDGTVVQAGPFAGLRLGATGTEGAHAARLLGCYERELHRHIDRLIARDPARVVNIGCADGYYAVGLALRLPRARVQAFDISERARAACAATAERNGVAGRVELGGEVTPALLRGLAGPEALLVVDIEGAEEALLDPTAVPELERSRLLVECHEGPRPGITARLAARFAPTHRVTRVDAALLPAELPEWLTRLGHLDQLLAVWEWRAAPTPWLVLEPAG